MTNNSKKTTENIVNDNAVYNIVNQVVKCDCDTAKHDPADYECACADCLDEQVERLNEMLIRKAILDDRQRILNSMRYTIDNVQTLCGIIDDPAKCFRVIEFMENLIKGEQK